jgi:hypothetical protein
MLGFILLFLCFTFLWVNEIKAVKTQKYLDYGEKVIL